MAKTLTKTLTKRGIKNDIIQWFISFQFGNLGV